MYIPTGLSTTALNLRQSRMAKREFPLFISTAQWPPKSSVLNPLDVCAEAFWRVRFSLKKYQNVDHVKTALCWEWAKIPQSYFRAASDGFVGRLKALIRTKGGQFEQI